MNRRRRTALFATPLYPARSWARPFGVQFTRCMRTAVPLLLAMASAGLAHAQGTMDFSGATTLMTTFNWRNDYVGVEQWSRNILDHHYVYLVALHQQHERFASTWDDDLRMQGFAEAFDPHKHRRG